MPYYESQQEKIKRMLAEALVLRGQEMPQGQMVSGHYVAPSVFQNLAPSVGLAGGIYKQRQAEDTQAQLDAQMQADAAQWMRERPQTTTRELPGPVMPGQEQPTAVTPPTQQQNLEWAQRGQTNPLTRALAAAYGADTLIKEPEREEARAFRASESEKERQQRRELALERNETLQTYYTGILTNQQASAEQKAEAAKIMQQLKEQELELKRQGLELQRQLGTMRDATTRYGIDNRIQANRAKMGQKQLADLDEADALLGGIDIAVNKLGKVDESSVESYARGVVSQFPFGGQTLANAFRPEDVKNARQLAADLSGGIKHGRYGAALSAGERADAAQYLPTEYDDPPEIVRKLNGLKTLMSLNNKRLRLMQDSGITLEEASRTYPTETKALQSPDFPTVRSGQVTTPPGEKEPTFSPTAAKQLLKPGTRFKGTDGNYYVR